MKRQRTMVSPTLVLQAVLARKVARESRVEPKHSYQSWHEALQEKLMQMAERHHIHFPIFLHNISPFWVPTIVQSESGLDEQQMCTQGTKKAPKPAILRTLINATQRLG